MEQKIVYLVNGLCELEKNAYSVLLNGVHLLGSFRSRYLIVLFRSFVTFDNFLLTRWTSYRERDVELWIKSCMCLLLHLSPYIIVYFEVLFQSACVCKIVHFLKNHLIFIISFIPDIFLVLKSTFSEISLPVFLYTEYRGSFASVGLSFN